jgi:hypothetical protein
MPDLILFYDAARYALAAGTLADGVFSETWSRQMDRDSLGGFAQVATATDRTIFYNPYSGQSRIFIWAPAILRCSPTTPSAVRCPDSGPTCCRWAISSFSTTPSPGPVPSPPSPAERW